MFIFTDHHTTILILYVHKMIENDNATVHEIPGTQKEALLHFGVVENIVTPVFCEFVWICENATVKEIKKCFGNLRSSSIQTVSHPELLNKIIEHLNSQC